MTTSGNPKHPRARADLTEDELRKLWEDERYWGHGPLGAYFCKEDPRLIVPKRRLFGGTFNLAHPWAVPILTAIIVLLVVLMVFGSLTMAFR